MTNISYEIFHLEENLEILINKKIGIQSSLILLPKIYFIRRYNLQKRLRILNIKITRINSKLEKLFFYLNITDTLYNLLKFKYLKED